MPPFAPNQQPSDQSANTRDFLLNLIVQAVNNLSQTVSAGDADSHTDLSAINTTLAAGNVNTAAINTTLGAGNTNTAAIVTALGVINATLAAIFPVTFLTGSKTYDPPSINDAASATTTLTVTGAVLGNYVIPGFSLDLQGLQLTAYVSAPDTVTFVLSNLTGAPVDLASGTISAKVLS